MIHIRSGAQTGVDRAALDAALDAGVSCGGWCPEGRLAEDGRIADRYPVSELSGADYLQRTRGNVIDSDGSVIVYFGSPTGGTEQTLACCIEKHMPYLLIDATEFSEKQAAQRIAQFVQEHAIADLNIAGPRASDAPGAYDFAYRALIRFLQGA